MLEPFKKHMQFSVGNIFAEIGSLSSGDSSTVDDGDDDFPDTIAIAVLAGLLAMIVVLVCIIIICCCYIISRNNRLAISEQLAVLSMVIFEGHSLQISQ